MPTFTTDTELYFPMLGFEGAISVGTGTINANDGGLCWVYEAEETATITRVSLRVSAVGTTPSSSLSVGLQSLTSGAPSGNWLDGAGTSSTNFAAEAGGSTGVKTYTLPNSVSLTAGQEFAIVVRNPTTGWTGNISFNLTHMASGTASNPYTITRSSGVWSTTRGFNFPSHAFYGSSSKWYGLCGLSTAESSSTIPSGANEAGFAITIPSGHPDVRLHTVYAKFATYNASSTFTCIVRDSSGTALNTTTYDQDFTSPSGYYPCVLSSDVWLTAGNKYFIMFGAATGTAPTPRVMTGFASAALLADVSSGVVCNTATYNGTTFTETTTARHCGSLVFNGVRYDQTGGTPVYIIPSGFNQLG
jgi:hypothetical protein